MDVQRDNNNGLFSKTFLFPSPKYRASITTLNTKHATADTNGYVDRALQSWHTMVAYENQKVRKLIFYAENMECEVKINAGTKIVSRVYFLRTQN